MQLRERRLALVPFYEVAWHLFIPMLRAERDVQLPGDLIYHPETGRIVAFSFLSLMGLGGVIVSAYKMVPQEWMKTRAKIDGAEIDDDTLYLKLSFEAPSPADPSRLERYTASMAVDETRQQRKMPQKERIACQCDQGNIDIWYGRDDPTESELKCPENITRALGGLYGVVLGAICCIGAGWVVYKQIWSA